MPFIAAQAIEKFNAGEKLRHTRFIAAQAIEKAAAAAAAS